MREKVVALRLAKLFLCRYLNRKLMIKTGKECFYEKMD